MKKQIMLSVGSFILMAHSLVFAEVININKADVATLDKLNGIGAKKAESIIAWREKHGEFKSLEALKDVPGIGEKLFEKLKNDIALTDTPVSTTTTQAAVSQPASDTASPPASVATHTAPATPPNSAIKTEAVTVEPAKLASNTTTASSNLPSATNNTASGPVLNSTPNAEKKP